MSAVYQSTTDQLTKRPKAKLYESMRMAWTRIGLQTDLVWIFSREKLTFPLWIMICDRVANRNGKKLMLLFDALHYANDHGNDTTHKRTMAMAMAATK